MIAVFFFLFRNFCSKDHWTGPLHHQQVAGLATHRDDRQAEALITRGALLAKEAHIFHKKGNMGHPCGPSR